MEINSINAETDFEALVSVLNSIKACLPDTLLIR